MSRPLGRPALGSSLLLLVFLVLPFTMHSCRENAASLGNRLSHFLQTLAFFAPRRGVKFGRCAKRPRPAMS